MENNEDFGAAPEASNKIRGSITANVLEWRLN